MTSKTKSARRNFRLAAVLLSGSALAGGTLAAHADAVWAGATSVDWYDATNWVPNAVPTSADNVLIDLMNNSTIISGGAATADQVNIGVNNTGMLTVTSGATLITSGDVTLGLNPGSLGNLLVDGGSTVTVGGANGLNVGIGNLQIQGASTVNSAIVAIDGAGAVDGVGTTLNTSLLGVGPTGSLSIQNGATLNTDNTIMGYAELTGTGTISLSGANTQWTNTVDLGVGTGTINIQSGAQVFIVGTSTIADGAGYVAAVTVDNTGSDFFSQTLNIGANGGTGTMTATDGGNVSAQTINLGIGAVGSVGSLTLDNSTLIANGAVNVGVDGTGTLILKDDTGSIVDALNIGVNSGSNGSATITDGASMLVQHTVTVGGVGTGTLSVLQNATFDANAIEIGVQSGANGTFLVDGGPGGHVAVDVVNLGLTAGVDSGATGAFTLSNGAGIVVGSVELGVFAGATGTGTVTSGSFLSSSSNIFIGEGGTGTLNVTAGGDAVSGFITYVGQGLGSTGTLNVDGAGSEFNTMANLLVGGDLVDPTGGTGIVNVTHGGVITDGSSLDLGASPGATGTMTIDGAGSSVSAVSSIVGESGTGILTVSNGGALTTSFLVVGSTTGSTGTIVVSGEGSSITDSGALEVGDSGTGTLTLSGGTVSAASVAISSGFGGIGTLNIGAAPGSTAAAPGTLNAPTLTFGALGSDAGVLNFNHTSAAYTFAPVISGAGTINQIAGATFLTADDSAFTGPTNITGGALHVNGSLRSSAVTVAGGGTLNGNGTVGAVTATSGGIVAPGNSIGTLSVNGNYSAASGSVYQVQLDSAGHSDLLLVSGTANIANGAILSISKTDTGGYVGGTQYTLLTATGGITGTYTLTGDVTQNIFASETLAYDAHDVYLDVTKVASFASAGITPNQKATGGGADTLPTTSPVYAALLELPSFAAARGAFDQLSGEIHASARTALVEDSRFVREAALDQLQGPNVDHPVVWAQGFGDWGSDDSNGNAAGMNRSTKGFIGGVNVPVYQTWRIGVLGGFSDTDLNVKDRSSAGASTNYHLGLYGGTETGPIAVRLGAAYSWHGLQTARAVAFNGFSEQLTAQYNGGTTQAFGEVGYKVDVDAVSLEPFANVAYVNLNMDAFQEVGGASALSVDSDATGTTFTTLGLHAKKQMDLGTSTVFTARASLGWRHAFGDITPVATNAFAGGTAFSIDGVPIAQDAAAIDAGFDAAVSTHLTLGLSYTGQFSSDARDHGIKANVGWKF